MNGAKLIREGASHEVWESKKGNRFTLPRHSEIGEITAKAILKQSKM